MNEKLHSLTMKFFNTLALLLFSGALWAQTGTAVVFLNEAEFEFTPTTVDSSLTVDFQLVNTIAATQSVFFGGLSGPFDLVDDSPVELNSQDTLTVSVIFTPSEIGTATDTLEVVGSIFGNAALVLSGEGIQVQLDWSGFDVVFETTAIGATSYADLNVTNVGNGTAVLQFEPSQSDVFSLEFVTDSVDYVDFTPGSLPEGETQILRFSFSPQNVGDTTQVLGLTSNSPLLPLASFTCMGSAVAELEGEVCADLTLANSPFNLVGPVVIPEGCSVNVEAGVQIIQNGHSITVFGDFNCLGTDDQPIDMYGGGLDLRAGPQTTLHHVNRIFSNQIEELVYIDNWQNYSNLVSAYSPIGGGFSLYNDNESSYEGTPGGASQLYMRKYDYEGYVVSIDTLYAPVSGNYEFSFIWQSTQIEELCDWSFQIWDGEQWITKVSHPFGTSGSNRKNLAKTEIQLDEGDLILWRFKLSPYSTSSSRNEVQLYVDDFRIGAAQNEVLVSEWDLDMIGDSLNLPQFAEHGLSKNQDTLRIAALDTDFSFNTSDHLSFPVFTVPSDGLYYLTFNYRTLKGEERCSASLAMLNFNENSAGMLYDYPNPYYQGLGESDWQEVAFLYPYSLTAGDEIHIDFLANIYSTSSGADEMVWEIVDMRLHQISTADGTRRNIDGKQLTVAGIVAEGAIIHLENSLVDDLTIANGAVTASDSQFKGISLTNTPGELYESSITGSDSYGINAQGEGSSLLLRGCEISQNVNAGVYMPNVSSDLNVAYCKIRNNGSYGIYQGGYNSGAAIDNSLLSQNASGGLFTYGSLDMNYCTVVNNSGYGTYVRDFSTVNNSILWFNSSNPQMYANNSVYASSYTNVQGINALLTDPDYAWGDGCIGTDPVLANEDGQLDPFSPCVDGAMPWEQDAHIPYGLGSSRADMGMYGGPANDYWGGQAPPDGAVQITDVFDIPQDQGGFVGLHFTASPFDFGGLGFNVTHYSIWRDLALGSDIPAEVGSGNWEQIGEVPAQGFGQYGYTAETLVDAYPGEEACLTSFIVIAHTTDDNIYWVSDVAAACSEDNLAPAEPEMAGLILAENGDDAIALLSWSLPEEEDYAYTSIAGSNGFLGTVSNGDTLITDTSIQSGQVVLYEAVHIDIHGNVSEPAFVELEAQVGSDVIELNAGWNLISTDRAVDQNVDEVFAGLSEGNLQYVTGFEGGVQFYDPSGLSFLNTLSTLTPGHGYWVKVEADDVLEVSGTRLDEAYMPGLLEGWNLVGYAAEDPAAPGDVFADLEAEGDLLYVTGFDQGVQVYDPNGLSFLNTLTEMRNGFGYWVKSAVATEGDVLAPLSDDVLPAAKPSPRYDVVNGTSALGDHAGEFVDVLDGWGNVVARLPILEGGHLMTTALFGDDPATGIVEGLAEGEVLHFAFRGNLANETLVFGGHMAHKTLALTFGELEAGLSVFPNPAVDMTTVRVHKVEAGLATLEVTDVQGRVVLRQDLSLAAGVHAVTLDLNALEGGAYNVELRQGTTPLGTSRLVVLD